MFCDSYENKGDEHTGLCGACNELKAIESVGKAAKKQTDYESNKTADKHDLNDTTTLAYTLADTNSTYEKSGKTNPENPGSALCGCFPNGCALGNERCKLLFNSGREKVSNGGSNKTGGFTQGEDKVSEYTRYKRCSANEQNDIKVFGKKIKYGKEKGLKKIDEFC